MKLQFIVSTMGVMQCALALGDTNPSDVTTRHGRGSATGEQMEGWETGGAQLRLWVRLD